MQIAFNAGYLAGWQNCDASQRGVPRGGCQEVFEAWESRHGR